MTLLLCEVRTYVLRILLDYSEFFKELNCFFVFQEAFSSDFGLLAIVFIELREHRGANMAGCVAAMNIECFKAFD